ncbi:MAG: DUF1641 domain-containing protein [Myxococcota bacterium]
MSTTSTSIEDRLTRVEAQLDRIAQLLERRPQSVLQSATQRAGQALANLYGDDEVHERIGELVLRLGEPETLEALTRIGVLLPQIEYILQFAAGGPELMEEGLEKVRSELTRLGTDPADLQLRTQAASEALVVLSKPSNLRALAAVVDAIAGAQPTIEALGEATQAHADEEGKDSLRSRLTETLTLLLQTETLDALGRVAALTPQLEYAVNALAAGPELLEEGMALIKSRLESKGANAAELSRRIDIGTDALVSLTKPQTLRAVEQLANATPALAPFIDAAARASRMLADYEGKAEMSDRLAESLVRIAEPETLDALTRVAALTPQIEYAINALAAGPEVLEEALETANHWAQAHGQTPHDINRRTQATAEALLALTEPKVLDTLASMVPMLVSLRSTFEQLASNASRIDIKPLVQLGESATEPHISAALNKLVRLAPSLAPALASLPIQPQTLAILRTINQAVENAATEKSSVGLFGLLGALRNPRVQRALGFTLEVADRLGEHLENPPKALPETT